MTHTEQRAAARKFVESWQGKGNEKSESQSFWIDLLLNVIGVRNPTDWISFEFPVQLKHTSFIDAVIPSTKVMIEQKSFDVDLNKAYLQSDGEKLTPYQQAKRYADELEFSKKPRWIVVCNFQEFHVHDMEHPHDAPQIIYLADLPKNFSRLMFLIDARNENIKREMELSFKAGDIVGKLYDAILTHYKDQTAESALKSLNMLCVRLVFCLYAEDAGIFEKNQFHDYLVRFDHRDLRRALLDLFQTLDTPEGDRDPYLDDALKAFPYVNGGLFADETIEIPQMDEEIKQLLLTKASDDFNWSEISPTIFGAVFESTLNPETRRSGGMHYTSIENIHKVIDPLFLDDIRNEFTQIRDMKQTAARTRSLSAFQMKLASLTFLDPACGSGNFLTETYLSLRRIENEVIRLIHGDKTVFLGQALSPVMLNITQFYGIEINDFAVAVAKTALWIAESQMLMETEEIVGHQLNFLPLKTNAGIVEGNALRMDWNTVIPKEKLRYIMGNPPFVGARLMSKEQKEELLDVFKNTKNAGNLDYVCGWYKIASDMMKGTQIRSALVSTNSITQGEQTALLWKPLFENGIHINFAYRTFRWDSEAKIKAHVHCVIIGFSYAQAISGLFDENGEKHPARNINPYLVDAPDIMIESRGKPLCNVPEIGMGNQPIDNGNYLFSKEEKDVFIQKEPGAAQYFKDWYGAQEFINRQPRYCLWLGDCSPAELRKMPECLKRVQAVRDFRLTSTRSSTLKLADSPTRFQTENMPKGNYIVIPETSSEKRAYTPMGFLSPDVFCSNAVRLMPDATLYHFGILTSSVHMAWMRTVCGRLKSDYRYSKDIVYNNFPWPEVTEEQREKISVTAQKILDARAKYPDCSLADLYDETAMPPELRKAHQTNDKAVLKAYGFGVAMTEPEIVAELMKRYQQLAAGPSGSRE